MKISRKSILALMSIILMTSCGTSTPKIYKADKTKYTSHYDELRKKARYAADLPSKGKPQILVIPVEFRDYTCAKIITHGGCEGVRNDIEASFFGEPEETAWESLTSFYKKSSYDQVELQGTVAPWYKTTYTVAQLAQKESERNPSLYILEEAVEWYRTIAADPTLKDFDSNGDGHIDAVWLVYAAPTHVQAPGVPAGSNLYWAYTYWNMSSKADVEQPTEFSYAWASYNFMYDDKVLNEEGTKYVPVTKDGKVMPDAHTWIHETGHLFGLPDYYTYDDIGKDYAAAGALDMMDNNIGDHNSYSKAILEWTEPTIVSSPGTVTLRPFESTGDSALIKLDWEMGLDDDNNIVPDKGTILDEYLMIEYYTPTGLNEWDSSHNYAENYPLLFTENGLKVYHVDSRIGGFWYSTSRQELVFTDFANEIGTRHTYYDIANSNTKSRTSDPESNFKLLHLLESSGVNSFEVQGKNAFATNETLFQTGDSFGYKAFKGFKFNTGEKLGLKFKVTAMDDESITIKFAK